MRDIFPTRWDQSCPRWLRLPWTLAKWYLVPVGAFGFVVLWVDLLGPWTAAWAIGFPLVFGFIEGLSPPRGSRNR